MKRLIILVAALLIISGISAPAQATQGAAKKYASCALLLEKHPKGVAKNKKARNRAVNIGFAKPRVSKRLYRNNGARLDENNDGVMCEQERPEEVLEIPKAFDPNDSTTWTDVEVDFIRYQTERFKTVSTSNQLFLCRDWADPAKTGSTALFYQGRADEGVRLFQLDPNRARQLIPHYYDRICHLLYGLHTRIV